MRGPVPQDHEEQCSRCSEAGCAGAQQAAAAAAAAAGAVAGTSGLAVSAGSDDSSTTLVAGQHGNGCDDMQHADATSSSLAVGSDSNLTAAGVQQQQRAAQQQRGQQQKPLRDEIVQEGRVRQSYQHQEHSSSHAQLDVQLLSQQQQQQQDQLHQQNHPFTQHAKPPVAQRLLHQHDSTGVSSSSVGGRRRSSRACRHGSVLTICRCRASTAGADASPAAAAAAGIIAMDGGAITTSSAGSGGRSAGSPRFLWCDRSWPAGRDSCAEQCSWDRLLTAAQSSSGQAGCAPALGGGMNPSPLQVPGKRMKTNPGVSAVAAAAAGRRPLRVVGDW